MATFLDLMRALEGDGWVWTAPGVICSPNGTCACAAVYEGQWPGGIERFHIQNARRLRRLAGEDWGAENAGRKEEFQIGLTQLVSALDKLRGRRSDQELDDAP